MRHILEPVFSLPLHNLVPGGDIDVQFASDFFFSFQDMTSGLGLLSGRRCRTGLGGLFLQQSRIGLAPFTSGIWWIGFGILILPALVYRASLAGVFLRTVGCIVMTTRVSRLPINHYMNLPLVCR